MPKPIQDTLLYFDLFHFPLKAAELRHCLHYCSVDKDSFADMLRDAPYEGVAFDGEYLALNNLDTKKDHRWEKELNASLVYKKVNFFGKIVASCPFVNAVLISGSLSKGCLSKDGDIDYFIITKSNRLWVAKLLLGFFKKLFLLNSHKYFCLNYFIDEDNLEIKEKNLFTATELKFLQPIYNSKLTDKFFSLNDKWADEFIPNFERYRLFAEVKPFLVFKNLTEKTLNWVVPSKLNDLSRNFYSAYRNWKYDNRKPDESRINFRTTNGVSKVHPCGMQFKVLNEFERRKKEFESIHV